MSRIGSLGADSVRALEAPTPGATRIAVDIAAAKVVLAAGIEGDGGEAGDASIEKPKNAHNQLQMSAG